MKNQLFAKKAGGYMPRTGLDAVVEGVQSHLRNSGAAFATKAIARAALSLESLDPGLRAELDSSVTGLSAALESLSRTYEQLSSQKYTGAQYAAATAAGIIASDIPAALTQQPVRDLPAMENMSFIMPMGGDMFSERMKPALEAYDERENRNAVVYSVAYNLQAARQDEFGEAFFPTVVVTPDQVGFTVSIRLVSVYDEVRRQITGALDQFKKRNIIHAVIDPTILRNDLLKIVPVYRDESKNMFVPATLLTPRDVNLEGEEITTSALAIGKKFSLLGISQTDALLETGLQDTTDSIDTAVTLSALFLKVTGDDGAGNTIEEVIKFNTLRLPTAVFNYAVQGNYRQMNLQFDNRSLLVNKNTKQASGAASVLLNALTSAEYAVRLGVQVFGSVNLETADTMLSASDIGVERVTDKDGIDLATGAGPGKTIADLFVGATIVGYELDARRTNLNRRMRGQLLDTTFYNQVYAVPLRSPITVPRPLTIGDANDTSDLAALITATHIRTSNAAVDELLNVAETLKEYVNTKDSLAEVPNILGVSRFLLQPFYDDNNGVVFDVSQEIDSLKSHERAADIQAVLVNKLRDMAYRMYRDCGYKAAADALAGGVAPTPTVIIGTDQYISRYLMVDGDFRTLGPDFNVKVVSTQNQRMRGKVVMSFGDFGGGAEGVPNPMHFGNMAWKPELTLVLPLHRNGANSKELTVQPSFLHVVNLPVMAVLEVEGISEIAAAKVPLEMRPV